MTIKLDDCSNLRGLWILLCTCIFIYFAFLYRWPELLVWLEMSDSATQCQAPRAVKNPKNLPVAKFQPTTLTTKKKSDYATTLILGYKDDQIKVIIIRWL